MSDASSPSKKEATQPKKDQFSLLREEWAAGVETSAFSELCLSDRFAKPAALADLVELEKIPANGEKASAQKQKIILSAQPAVSAVCREAFLDAHQHAYARTKAVASASKVRLLEAQNALMAYSSLSPYFPELNGASEAVAISLKPPFFANDKVELITTLISQKKPVEVLSAVAPNPKSVSGFFGKDRMGMILTANNMTEESAKWAATYIGDCIRRGPGEKRAKLIVNLLTEASETKARKYAIEEAAIMVGRMAPKDQEYVSRKLHKFSRGAYFKSPDKALFHDFAEQARRQPRALENLFPLTLEERAKAGKAFRNDTTLIMGKFHASVEKAERAQKARPDTTLSHPLEELMKELDGAPVAEPKEPTPAVVIDQTRVLAPEAIASKFAKGETVRTEELDTFIFKGQPAHRIVNAAKMLVSVPIPDKDAEKTRNRMVTSILLHLEPAGFPDEFSRSEGRKLESTEELSAFVSSLEARLFPQNAPASPKTAPLPAPKEQEPVVAPPAPKAPSEDVAPGYPNGMTVKQFLKEVDKKDKALPLPAERAVLAVKAISKAPSRKRMRLAYKMAFSYFSKGKDGYSYTDLDFIRDLAAHVRISNDPEARQFATDAAEALLSLPEVSDIGPVEAAEMRTLLASANPEIVNPAALNKIHHGTKNEAGHALLVLAERAEIYGRAEGASLYGIALSELAEMGHERAIHALFSLSNTDCPTPLLLETLAYSRVEDAGNMAAITLLKKNAEQPDALFADEWKTSRAGRVTDGQMMLATKLLDMYGGATPTEEPVEARVAKGLSMVKTPAAVEFLIVGLADAETGGRTVWRDALESVYSSGPELAEMVESKLISNFDLLDESAGYGALELLCAHPSFAQARFLLALASEDKFTGRIAEEALSEYNFSPLSNSEKFEVMRRMYVDGMPEGKGADLLKEYIPAHSKNPKSWLEGGFQISFLSQLAGNAADPELAKIAMDSLLSSAEGIFSVKYGVRDAGVLEFLGSTEDEERELAKYAAASQMIAQGEKFSPALHKAIYSASVKFKKEGSDNGILALISAAEIASTPEAMRQVLVPYLAGEKAFSEASANALLSSEEGARQLALAAAAVNHPNGLSQENSRRISACALAALSKADTERSARALVSLLGVKQDDLHLSAYEALENAGDSKCPALTDALSSSDSWTRYAAVKLLPRSGELLEKVLPLSIDPERSVSASAIEYFLSVSGAKGLSALLANANADEGIQQAASEYCARSKPAVMREILALAQKDGPEAEQAIRSLEFFPTSVSFPALISVLESHRGTSEVARETIIQMCWLLSTDASGEAAENAANDLMGVYGTTRDEKVRGAIIDAAKGEFATAILEDAIANEAHTLPAFEIFITTQNAPYATETAQYIMGRPFATDKEPGRLPPLWQVLFLRDFEKMGDIVPGTTSYSVLREVAELQFMHGQGSTESRELLFAFMKNFGSATVRDGLFERGPLAVSELLWSVKGDPSEERVVLWLRSMEDEQTNTMLDVLKDQNYSALDRVLEDDALSAAVCSHALRRALLAFASLSIEGADAGAATEGLELYSQIFARDVAVDIPSNRKAEFATLKANLGLEGKITPEGVARGEGIIRSLCTEAIDFISMRSSARAEANKLSRAAQGAGAPAKPAAAQKLQRK